MVGSRWEKPSPSKEKSSSVVCAQGVVPMCTAAFLSSKTSQRDRAWLQGCSRWEKTSSPIKSLVCPRDKRGRRMPEGLGLYGHWCLLV